MNDYDINLILFNKPFKEKASNNNFYQGIKLTILTLIGFAIYNFIIVKIIDTKHIPHYNIKLAVDDILKFGTVYIFTRILSGQSFFDREWINEVIFILFGFIIYDLFTIHIVDTEIMEKENEITRETKLAINDIIKFSTMFLISGFLMGREFNKEWLTESFGFIISLVAYDYLLSDIF